MKIIVTGPTGFVGKNLIPYLTKNITESEIIPLSIRYGDSISASANVYIHLAGKAHDTRNISKDSIYYEANYLLTKSLFDKFLEDSEASCFIYISSIKAIAESPGKVLVNEEYNEEILSVYGKSKRMAEEHILSNLNNKKRVFILRPCMIHGPGNKGNLNLLYKLVKSKIPWLLADFDNLRSMCSIDNFNFIIHRILIDSKIKAGVYNVADSIPISTNHLVGIISECLGYNIRFYRIPRNFIKYVAKLGDLFNMPFNTSRLIKLTENFVISNDKIITEIGQELPVNSIDGLKRTIYSFKS